MEVRAKPPVTPISPLPLLTPVLSGTGVTGTLFEVGIELSAMQLKTACRKQIKRERFKDLWLFASFSLFSALPLPLRTHTSHVSPSLKLLCVFTLSRSIIHARQERQLIRTAFI